MVEREIRDPERIGALLAAELEGQKRPPFDDLSIEWSTDRSRGTPTFVARRGAEALLEATVQPDRLLVTVRRSPAAVADAARGTELRVRPKGDPPATLLFLERGAAVKRVIDALRAMESGQ